MTISKRVKIGHNDYYIIVELEYMKKEENFPILCLKNYKDKYWDGGDCSILIEEIENTIVCQNCTFTAFVVAAVKFALENVQEKEKQ